MRALKRVEGINVVPLIDVVLVLLAIVLTISTFVASGAIKLNLPSSSSAVQTPAQKIDIAVDEKGSMFWNGKELSPQEVIVQIGTLNQDSQVSIRGDKRAMFNDFIFILDRLKLQKIEKISIVTKRES